MAVPKRKISKARRDKRRNSHWKLDLPGMSKCPKCGGYMVVKGNKIACADAGCGYTRDRKADEDTK